VGQGRVHKDSRRETGVEAVAVRPEEQSMVGRGLGQLREKNVLLTLQNA
jgi:hypothetical protein